MYNIYPARFFLHDFLFIRVFFFFFILSYIKHSFGFGHIYLRIRLIHAYDEL